MGELRPPTFTTLSSVLYRQGKDTARRKLHKWAVKKGVWQNPHPRPEHFDWELAQRWKATPFYDDHSSLHFLKRVSPHWERLRKEGEELSKRGVARFIVFQLVSSYLFS